MRCHCWHSGMPLCRTRAVSRFLQHHQAPPSLVARNQWMTWMDSSMNERMVPRYLHVPFCCFCDVPSSKIFPISGVDTFPPLSPFGFQCYIWLFCVVVIQVSHFSCIHIFPIFPFWFSMSIFSWPLFLLTHFPPFAIVVFKVFFFCTAMFLIVRGGFSMIFQWSLPFRSCIWGGLFDLGIGSPKFL